MRRPRHLTQGIHSRTANQLIRELKEAYDKAMKMAQEEKEKRKAEEQAAFFKQLDKIEKTKQSQK